MPGFSGALISSADALRAFENALTVVQNNVANVSTPGYAKQRATFLARPFSPELGLMGGVDAGALESARDQYAERSVRGRTQSWGMADQTSVMMARVEPMFDATGKSGLPSAISKLFQGFSSWSMAPNDGSARQGVLDAAQQVAGDFRETAAALDGLSVESQNDIRDLVGQINQLAGRIRDINVERQSSFNTRNDPSMDATLQTALERLSELGPVTALEQSDGSVTVLFGGQIPLVVGAQQYTLKTDMTGGQARVLDFTDADVTGQFSGGRLRAAVDFRNSSLPSFRADLNQLATVFAGMINGKLTTGLDRNGAAGRPLFDIPDPTNAAGTIRLNPTITTDQLAAADATAPGGNGNALALAQLADQPQALLGNTNPAGFYGNIAQRAGTQLTAARGDAATQQQLLLQAKSIRSEHSSVSLDEEAVQLMQFQRAYQATARMVSVLDSLTEETLNMLK
jgi:flagellar hook-associated protein 1